jgi:hypothetical protein
MKAMAWRLKYFTIHLLLMMLRAAARLVEGEGRGCPCTFVVQLLLY